MPVWLKMNTGMNRLGFDIAQLLYAQETLSGLNQINLAGVMTHFSDADAPIVKTQEQIDYFYQHIKPLAHPMSLANSAGILAWQDAHADWVRPGIMLYGISPFADKISTQLNLKPVMSLKSEIIAIQEVEAGQAVGYGSTYVCKTRKRIGVVAAGYGDGYPQTAPSGTPVFIAGKIVPTVGRVSMDMLCVDLTDIPQADVGESVELWGTNLPVEEVAKSIGCIAYALVTGVSARVPRIKKD